MTGSDRRGAQRDNKDSKLYQHQDVAKNSVWSQNTFTTNPQLCVMTNQDCLRRVSFGLHWVWMCVSWWVNRAIKIVLAVKTVCKRVKPEFRGCAIVFFFLAGKEITSCSLNLFIYNTKGAFHLHSSSDWNWVGYLTILQCKEVLWNRTGWRDSWSAF